jgi:hypothetical protein
MLIGLQVMHDHGHKGVTNDYLVNTQHELALRYNDASPHENHHAACSFALLYLPSCNFSSGLPRHEQKRLRHLVIELVLATDVGGKPVARTDTACTRCVTQCCLCVRQARHKKVVVLCLSFLCVHIIGGY